MLSRLSHLGAVASTLGSSCAAEGPVCGCSIDSRTIGEHELFFALRGPRHDGHGYIAQVLARGAAGAVVERSRDLQGSQLMAVPDTREALQRLSGEARRLWGGLVVGVTGSAGKTTAKEMIYAALATRWRVRKSEGNLNNEYGLPLSLLRLEDDDQVGVFEMGMSHPGEITQLARLARPQIGVITNVGPVHLEFFENLEAIARAKYELIEALPAEGIAVLNGDDPLVSQFRFSGQVLTFGIDRPADFRAVNIAEGETQRFEAAGEQFEIHLPGRHQILNALAALAVASTQQIAAQDVAAALAKLRPQAMRGERVTVAGATLICDCYNSNPRAAEAMLDALALAPASGRRWAVLGEMLELGDSAPSWHHQVGAKAAGTADFLIGVRGLARHFLDGARQAGMDAGRMWFVETPEKAAAVLERMMKPGDLVLLKASRGVKLEKALEKLAGLVAAP